MAAIELPEARALLAALPAAADLVRRPEVTAAWAQRSDLDGFSVGGVAGHLVRAVGRLEPTLDEPAPAGDVAGLDDWYLGNRVEVPGELDDIARWIRDDGEQLAAKGAPAVADELDAMALRLADRLAAEPDDRMVVVVRTDRPVPVRDYLASRVLEVVVHADDVATASSTPTPSFDASVLDVVLSFVLRLARARAGDLEVLRALTRSQRVPDPYDVLRVL